MKLTDWAMGYHVEPIGLHAVLVCWLGSAPILLAILPSMTLALEKTSVLTYLTFCFEIRQNDILMDCWVVM